MASALKKNSSAYIELDLLPYAKDVKSREGMIWDPTRKKWLERTPEEVVRQGLIRFFYQEMNFDFSKMRSEYQIHYNKLKKRLDLVLFDKNGDPLLLAEVKSWKVSLDHKVLKQLGTYNTVVQAPFILACNGNMAILAKVDRANQETVILTSWPDLEKIKTQNE